MPDFAAALSDLTGAPPSAADRALAVLNATPQTPRSRPNNFFDQFDNAPDAPPPAATGALVAAIPRDE